MKKVLTLVAAGLLLATANSASAADYSRYGIGSVTILDGMDPANGIAIRGSDHFPELDEDFNELPPVGGYALVPFSFAARDFNLESVDQINSVQLELFSEIDPLNDDAEVEIFYVPDSRADLGFDYFQETATCDWGHNGGDFAAGWSARCYQLGYDASNVNGIPDEGFSAAPISLGTFDLEVSGGEQLLNSLELDFGDAASQIAASINADEEFHLLFATTSDQTYMRLEDFGGSTRPLLAIDADGAASSTVTKDLIRQGAIHAGGDTSSWDFYGSGNDDNFSEYGIASFEFSKDDFGVADDITEIGSVELTLAHNDRSFSDGDSVEFFLVGDTAAELGFDDNDPDGFPGFYANLTFNPDLDNGIDESQFETSPISLGTYDYVRQLGSRRETFSLELSDDAEAALLASINSGEDFQIIVASPDAESDITFSGISNGFDPGNPQLSISLDPVEEGFSLDVNGDGTIDAADAELLCGAVAEAGVDLEAELIAAGYLPGDVDLNAEVNFADFLALSGSFNMADATYAQGDVDCSGTVNFTDFLTLSANFGQSAAAASVPEPSSALMVLLSLVGIASLRRRR